MSVASKIPPLRFKGFEGEWDKKCFSDFAKVRRGLTYSPMDCAKHEIRVLRSSNIEDDKFVLHDDDVFVKKESANISSAEVGDILITAANGSSQLVGKHALIRGIAACTAVHGGFMLLATSTESVFLNAAMSAPWYRNTVASLMMGGNGALGNLCQDAFETMMFIAPQGKKERDQLGIIFRSLDALIAVRESAVEKLQTLKKAMLEKMFPRADAKVPEVRFKGFDREWERKPLEEIVKKRNESVIAGVLPKLEYEDIVSFEGVLKQSLDQLYVEKRGISFYVGDVLFGKLRPYLGNWFHATFDGVAVGDWWVLKPVSVVSEYLYVLIQSDAFQVAANQSAGSKMPRADWNLVSETLYPIPPTVEEQQKIGAYFRSLDALISARQGEVVKLKDLKKALLDRMFV